MELYATPGTIVRVYYSVPMTGAGGHDFGRDVEAAVEYARSTIKRV